MPMFPPDLSEALRSLQRQIDQINTARPGPMSWGPGDGHTRFYGPDGTTVLFEAVGGAGASVVSRGALTGMTGLLDSIRDTDDAQSGRLNDQQGWIIGQGERLDGHDNDVTRIDAKNGQQDGRLTGAEGRLTGAEGRLGGHDSTLASHGTRLGNAEATDGIQNTRLGNVEAKNTSQDGVLSSYGGLLAAHDTAIAGKASTGAVTTAQERADSAYARAGTAIADAAAAESRAQSAQLTAARAASDIISIISWINRNLLGPAGGGVFPSDIPR